MERLTKRLSSGASDYNYPESCYFDDNSGPDRIAQSAFRQRCVERLADYEDKRLTPEEVSTLVKDWNDLCTIVGECSGITRVKALAEAEKEGRLVVLPCKVGDMLYEVTGRKTISVYKVKAIRVELFGLFIEWDIVEGFVWQSLTGINAGEIGKTVFLTREEAEKALEAMK